MLEHPFRFSSPIELLDFGKMAYAVVYLPESITNRLPSGIQGRIRVDGVLDNFVFNGALQPASGGERYILLSKRVLRSIGREVGDTIAVAFSIADPNAVQVPIELQHALQANELAGRVWQALTSGKRRGYAHRVSIAKKASTKAKRIEELMDELLIQRAQ